MTAHGSRKIALRGEEVSGDGVVLAPLPGRPTWRYLSHVGATIVIGSLLGSIQRLLFLITTPGFGSCSVPSMNCRRVRRQANTAGSFLSWLAADSGDSVRRILVGGPIRHRLARIHGIQFTD